MKNKHETIISLIKFELQKTIIKQKRFIIEHDVPVAKLNVQVEATKNLNFGDYTSNSIMLLGLQPELCMEFGNLIAKSIDKKYFSKIDVVKPGFINFFINPNFNVLIINDILEQRNNYGHFSPKKTFYNIEFVSANPTGLLHIGHARNAAIGDSLANIWEAYGLKVNREYYINDSGNQIEKLGLSTLIRYRQLFDCDDKLPEDAYHGNEVIEIAKEIKTHYGDKYLSTKYDNEKILSKDEGSFIKNFAKEYLLKIIKNTLLKFDVKIQIWFGESQIYEHNLIKTTLEILQKHTYKQEGALWLKTSKLGDDKDRVLIKSDGSYTYFLPDIAYHNIKLSRGYDKIFNIWGSDHASYANRIRIAIQLLGYSQDQIHVLIMQMVRLVKGGQEFKMSKRSGISLTLQDLLDTIGKDAARWFLVSQTLSTHFEIDVDKAVSKNSDNPLYYVQYAHARIHQILKNARYDIPEAFTLLNSPHERQLINNLHHFKDNIALISNSYEVNKMTLYLTNLAKSFHAFYTNNRIIDENNVALSQQRYWLCYATKQVIHNGLKLLGIDALEKMQNERE